MLFSASCGDGDWLLDDNLFLFWELVVICGLHIRLGRQLHV